MTNKLISLITNYYRSYYKDTLNIPNWEDLTNKQLSEEKEELKRIKDLEKKLGNFNNKTILDMGCGTGGFVIASSSFTKMSYGIEPDDKALKICLLKKSEFRKKNVIFQKGFGEKLPYENHFFNIVHTLTVLEHVQSVEKTLSEMIRVTKKGGKIYIKTPNYLTFYEGHYKIFWLPLFPKLLAKLYLKIRNRPCEFIDTINYLTPNYLKKILEKQKSTYNLFHYPIKRHKGLLNLFIYLYQKIFRVEQNIEILIKV